MLHLFLACTASNLQPGAEAPDPSRVAGSSLGRGFVRDEGAWRARGRGWEIGLEEGAALRMRDATIRLGHGGGWKRSGSRIEQENGPVTTWWQVGAVGLEFGFRLDAPSEIVLEVDGARVEPIGDDLILRAPGGWAHISGLVARDATGAEVPATMAPTDGGIRFTVEADRYPVEIDPLVSGDWAVADAANSVLTFDATHDGYGDIFIGSAFTDISSTDAAEGQVLMYAGGVDGPEATASWTFEGTEDNGHAGGALARGDFDADGYQDLVIGVPGDSAGRGACVIWEGSSRGYVHSPDHIDGTIEHTTFCRGAAPADVNRDGFDDLIVTSQGPFGIWLHEGSRRGLERDASWYVELPDLDDEPPAIAVGDVDGDGWVDLVVGMKNVDVGVPTQGQAWVMLGRPTGFASMPDVIINGTDVHGKCGDAVAVGDWNADGYDDVAIGCPEVDDYYSLVGKVQVHYGSAAGIGVDPDWIYMGDYDNHGLGGLLLDDGDLDGDGYHELLAGGTGAGLEGPGRVNIIAGGAGGLEATPRWWWAGSGEGWVATSASGSSDIDGDGYVDLVLGSGRIDADGRTWLLPGGPDGPAAEAPGWRAAEEDSYANCVAAVPDLDGDGLDEIAVGSTDDGVGVGHAYIFEGMTEGVGEGYWFALADTSGEAFGTAIEAVGDVDGDGTGDLVVGAPEADNTYTDEGRVDLYTGTGTSLSLVPTATLWGGEDGAGIGAHLLGVGDMDGDGYADLLIAQPEWSGTYTGEGRVRLYAGSAAGFIEPAYIELTGGQDGAALGSSMARAGDVNGDGRQDVLLGAPGWDATEADEGKVELWLGDGRGMEVVPDWTVYGGVGGAEGGWVAGGGDADGDGVFDVLHGLPGLNEVDLYLDYGAAPDWTITGPGNDAEFGGTLAFAGDVDGDGDDDFLIGAPNYNEAEGAAWLYTGEPGGASDVAAMSWRGGWPDGCFSCSLTGAMELNGDGYEDFAIASPGLGLVELWYGGPLDGDGDGYRSDSDCDDTTATVHPGALESENGVDEDCDGLVDNPATWYVDADGDGFGDPATGETTFSPDWDAVLDATDCDDTEGAVNPVGRERCDGVDNDCNGAVDDDADDATAWYTDADGDGVSGTWAALDCTAPEGADGDGSDCDDEDASVYPGALEACDGVDNDCSGVLDDEAPEDAVTYYPDLDGDGYGDDSGATAACGEPAGWVTVGGDCDDDGALINPSVLEICNGVDDDCDGTPDDGATDALSAFEDKDGDLHGDAASMLETCSIPIGWVRDPDDCDDTNPAIFPGHEESCDGVDEDCDGAIDNNADDGVNYYLDKDGDGYGSLEYTRDCGMPENYVLNDDDCDDYDAATLGPVVWFKDDDRDGYGDVTDRTLSCSGPSSYTANDEDCDDTRGFVHPDALELCDEVDNDCDGNVDNDAVDAETWYADADGDGHGDPEYPTVSCDPVDGSTESPDDCDDTDATIGAPAWVYQDADGDGFGDSTVTQVACPGESGWVLDSTDCDDTRWEVNPDASETCDGVDEDCDLVVDNNPADGSIWYEDADGDGFGNYDEATYGCTGDTLDSTDCDDTNPHVSPVGTELWYDGIDQDCDGNDADQDRDGVLFGEDCDDEDATIGVACPEKPAKEKAPEPEGRCSGCATGEGMSMAGVFAVLGLIRRRRSGH